MTVITNNQAPVPESHDGYGNGPSKRAVDANGNPNVGLPWHGAGLPHVEDIASAPTDIDANQSIKRLLDQSQTLMGQADMFRELGRIDFALREYIKSYTIAFQTVPNHDEYTSLPNDRPELYKRHRALKAQLDTHFNTYMQIKEQIRADNLRTGVKPTRVHHVRTQTSSHTRSGSNASVNNPAPGAARQSLDQYVGADARPKPPVQPKPQSLHGRALQNGHVKSSSVSSAGDSLTARFKNLGGPTTSPGQDPRIRTHPIAAPKPAGPREMPSAAKPALGVDTTSPFPARPAAIYVPTRPNMTAEAAQLPSSATRTHPSRSGSYASHPGTPNGTVKPPSNDYFTPPSRSNTGLSNGRVSLSENRNEIQSGETISPSELKTLMNKYSILIIDTRARSEFDEGHIMSTSIICVEPDILSRGDIGAADIADSLILSPSHEQEIFNKRNEYDLIVYYNQMSKSLQSPPSSLEEQVIVSLHRALTLLNDPPLKRNPKLLKGGLDAWIDFLGPACLQATVASDADRPKLLPPGPRSRRRSSYVPIELPQQDIEGFQEDINREYYRTQDDFVKRYPAVPVKQESMVLSSPQQVPQRPFARPPAPTESIPKPLQAPEPAKARASHTYHGSHDGSHDGGSNMRGTGAGTIPGAIGTKMTWRTGLDNPHNWCYANSVIQSLLVSNFGSELAEATQWKRRYIVPRKQGEKTAPPQLMIQMLSNLFYWMENKSFKVMKADTLLRYARHVREQQKRRERTPDFALFGDTNQQDAHEFQEWLWSELDNETNTRRNVNEPTGEALWPKVTQRHELQGAADRFFTEYMKYHDSIYDMYRTFVTVTESRCPSCSKQNWAWEASHHLFVPSDRDATLAQCLDQAANVQSDFTCDHCKTLNKKVNIRYRYQRLPRMLCIQFSRFDARPGPNGYSYYKLAHRIEWDLDNFDMSPWLIDGPNKEDARYECIAVIQHTGQSMHSGHYTAHTRKGTNWWLCNDHKVSRLSPGEVRKEIFDQNDRSVPYLVWFQKKV